MVRESETHAAFVLETLIHFAGTCSTSRTTLAAPLVVKKSDDQGKGSNEREAHLLRISRTDFDQVLDPSNGSEISLGSFKESPDLFEFFCELRERATGVRDQRLTVHERERRSGEERTHFMVHHSDHLVGRSTKENY